MGYRSSAFAQIALPPYMHRRNYCMYEAHTTHVELSVASASYMRYDLTLVSSIPFLFTPPLSPPCAALEFPVSKTEEPCDSSVCTVVAPIPK